MSTNQSTVAHWTDQEPTEIQSGVQEYALFDAEDTPAKRVSASLLVIDRGATYEPGEFHGEIFYHFLAGNGILVWNKDHTDLPLVIDNDTGGWIPGTHSYSFENTGEGPMRCLAVSCETEDTDYGVRDGSVGKLDTFTPTARKIDDTFHDFGANKASAKNLVVAGYQVFAPGKKQGLHYHDEEVLYVVRGSGKLVSGSDEFDIEAGTIAHNPHEIEHQLLNTGKDKLGYVVLEFSE